MLEVELENKLPASWIKEVKENVPYEDPPYLLWDRNDKMEVQLLKYPEIAKNMADYINSLIKISEEKYLPYISKK